MCEKVYFMNSAELKRFLKKNGCTFESHRGGSGHLMVRRGDRTSQLPMHGSRKELGTKLVRKILKDLGMEP
jgi:mRNA interferase HicA